MHIPKTLNQYMHSILALNTCTQHMHSIHAFNTCIQHIQQIHAFNTHSYIQLTMHVFYRSGRNWNGVERWLYAFDCFLAHVQCVDNLAAKIQRGTMGRGIAILAKPWQASRSKGVEFELLQRWMENRGHSNEGDQQGVWRIHDHLRGSSRCVQPSAWRRRLGRVDNVLLHRSQSLLQVSVSRSRGGHGCLPTCARVHVDASREIKDVARGTWIHTLNTTFRYM